MCALTVLLALVTALEAENRTERALLVLDAAVNA